MLAPIRNPEFRKLLLCWPEKAIAILYESHYDALLIISQRITLDLLASEAIVQDAFTRLWCAHNRRHNTWEPIQHEMVRLVRKRSLKWRKARRGFNESNLKITEELEDVAFLFDNIPELPDEYVLDDNFYHGLRQIEYRVNGILNRQKRLRDFTWQASVILFSLSLLICSFFVLRLRST
ncbi:MAG: hypothetical protein WKF87_03690 [Chryseolinea sp.]